MNFLSSSAKRFLTIAIWAVSFLIFSKKGEAQSNYHADSVSANNANLITKAWIKSHLKKTGPKIIITTESLQQIKSAIQTDSLIKAYYNYLYKNAEALITIPVLQRKLEGRRLLTVSREAVKRIGTLAIVYAISTESRFLNRVNDELLAVSNFSDWNPSHFLDVGEMAYAVSVGLDWTLGKLPLSTQETVKQALINKALKPGLAEPESGWVSGHNNWNQVCHGGLSIAAIAVADEDPALAAQVISRALTHMPKALHSYAPDGAYPEGASYWGYGTSYSLLTFSAFESAFNTDFGLSQSPGFMQSALFVKLLASPSGLYFNYFDSGSGTGGLENNELLSWFAARANNGAYFDKAGMLSALAKMPAAGKSGSKMNGAALSWMAKVGHPSVKPFPAAWKGDGVNPIIIFTSSKSDLHHFFLGAKGGAANLSHGDMDAGSFVFDLNDVRWSVDLGMPDYTALEAVLGVDGLWNMSQSSKRWTLMGKNNFGHSTLTVNDSLHKVNGAATLTHFKLAGNHPEAQFDLSKVFGGQLKSAKRIFKKLSDQSLQIDDEIEVSDSTQSITWAMMTQAGATPIDGGILLKQGGKILKVTMLQPKGIKCKVISKNPPPLPYDMKVPDLKRLEFKVPASALKNKKAHIIVELSGQ